MELCSCTVCQAVRGRGGSARIDVTWLESDAEFSPQAPRKSDRDRRLGCTSRSPIELTDMQRRALGFPLTSAQFLKEHVLPIGPT